jgi:hypothetical protein
VKETENIHDLIKEVHSKNLLILEYIATQTQPLPPDLINTRIVAQSRLETTLSALTELNEHVDNGLSKKKMKKTQTRLRNNIVKEIGFGSLQELADQAHVELQRLGVKQP